MEFLKQTTLAFMFIGRADAVGPYKYNEIKTEHRNFLLSPTVLLLYYYSTLLPVVFLFSSSSPVRNPLIHGKIHGRAAVNTCYQRRTVHNSDRIWYKPIKMVDSDFSMRLPRLEVCCGDPFNNLCYPSLKIRDAANWKLLYPVLRRKFIY